MSREEEIDINQILLKAHRLGVKKAIEASERSNIPLVVYRDGKVKKVKPKARYVRVPIDELKNKHPSKRARQQTNKRSQESA